MKLSFSLVKNVYEDTHTQDGPRNGKGGNWCWATLAFIASWARKSQKAILPSSWQKNLDFHDFLENFL